MFLTLNKYTNTSKTKCPANCLCVFFVWSLHTAVLMSRGRSNGSRMRRNSVRDASVLQRPQWYRHPRRRRQQCSWSGWSLPVKILPAHVTARRKDPVAGVRERHYPILVSWCDVQWLRCVIRKTTEAVWDWPMEMHERHVRWPHLWRVRCCSATQQYKRYTTYDYNTYDWLRWWPYFYCNTTHVRMLVI